MNKLFELSELKNKVNVEERNSAFLEFIMFVANVFEIETSLVEEYFLN